MSDAPEATPALRPLTERQRRFVEAYCATGSPLKAARAAGYSPKHARVYGQDLLKLPHVRAAVEARWGELAHEVGYTQKRVQVEIAAISYARVDMFVVDQATGRVRTRPGVPKHYLAAVSGVKTVTGLVDGKPTPILVPVLFEKNASLTTAGKNLGMFVERVLTAETTLDDLLREAARDDGDA